MDECKTLNSGCCGLTAIAMGAPGGVAAVRKVGPVTAIYAMDGTDG